MTEMTTGMPGTAERERRAKELAPGFPAAW